MTAGITIRAPYRPPVTGHVRNGRTVGIFLVAMKESR
jgi:hypothetical protein